MSLLLSGCGDRQILIKKMNEKYSNDQNYVVLTGTIVEVVLEGSVLVIKSEDLKLYHENYDTDRFMIYGGPIEDLNVGDEIVFTTVVFYFYNGHILPIVELKKDGVVLLSFEEGKQNLLGWVNEDFR